MRECHRKPSTRDKLSNYFNNTKEDWKVGKRRGQEEDDKEEEERERE